MHRLTSSFILGYHGCSARLAEQLVSGEARFKSSENDHDWLGPGIYFWQSNPRRALEFAKEKRARDRATWTPAVVGAVINPGLCLDLSTEIGIVEVRTAYRLLRATFEATGEALPRNSIGPDMLLRRLDCAVVRQLHAIRERTGEAAVDTVRGIFVEGGEVFEGSGFRDRTHIQICVCKPKMILGVFGVRPEDLESP